MAGVKPDFLSPEGYLVGVNAVAITGDGVSVFQKAYLEQALRSYGEDDIVEAVRKGLTNQQVSAIGVRHCALTYVADPARNDGSGYPADKALALAAVEVVEGRSRKLARSRRRSR